jgi:8-oxo-dGTP pyrophosphatase MutT (NUDIX family)
MYTEVRRFAGAFVVCNNGQIMLQLRDNIKSIDNPGTISVFGGSLEKNESYIEGLKRELKEELNVVVDDIDLKSLPMTAKIENNIKTECQFYILTNVDPNICVVSEGQAIFMNAKDALIDQRLTSTCRLTLSKAVNHGYFVG